MYQTKIVSFSQQLKLSLSVYHKRLGKEFEEQFECLEEKTEKYKLFSVLIKREVTKVDPEENENIIIISYKMKFNNSERFAKSS